MKVVTWTEMNKNLLGKMGGEKGICPPILVLLLLNTLLRLISTRIFTRLYLWKEKFHSLYLIMFEDQVRVGENLKNGRQKTQFDQMFIFEQEVWTSLFLNLV